MRITHRQYTVSMSTNNTPSQGSQQQSNTVPSPTTQPPEQRPSIDTLIEMHETDALLFDDLNHVTRIRDAEILISEEPSMTTNETTQTTSHEETRLTNDAVPTKESHALRFGILTTGAVLLIVFLGIKYLGNTTLVKQYAENSYDVVALVNGERILQKEFDQQLAFLMQTAVQQQRDVNDPTLQEVIREQALDLLVNAKILTQAAHEQGMTVDTADIDAQYALIAGQYGTEEEFLAQVEALGFTIEKVRQNIHDELLISKYIAVVVPESASAVTEAEVKEYYTRESATRTDVPPLEVVSGQIEEFLKQQKQQVELQRVVDSLRSSANIEIEGEEKV